MRSTTRRRKSDSSWPRTRRSLRAVHERSALQQLEHNLNAALSSRDVIGQAKGILMERLNLPPEEAFDALRRSSQRLNEKLREVASRLAETGQFDRRGHVTTAPAVS